MKADIVVENIGQLVTCATSGGPKRGGDMRDVGMIDKAAVAIADGKFIGVGSADSIRCDFDADKVVDAFGAVVCPGFVDPHTHIVFAGERLDEFELKIRGAEYLEILAAGGGILSTVRQTRAASVETLVELAIKRLDKMLISGTTTCEIKTGYGLDTESELKMLDAIDELDHRHSMDVVPTFLAAHAVPPEFKEDPNSYVAQICEEMLPIVAGRQRGTIDGGSVRRTFVDVFCERNAFDLEQSRRILVTAKGLGLGVKAHVDEFTNLGGSRMAIELGATSIDHLDAISDEEIDLLAASETIGIITPTVNFNFGSADFADARKLIDSGCIVALSTDYNPGSAPCPSQSMVMAIACRYQKLLPAEAMNAITINSAYAIGMGASHGSIEVGKSADLVVADVQDYRELAYEFGGAQIRSVMKNGRFVRG